MQQEVFVLFRVVRGEVLEIDLSSTSTGNQIFRSFRGVPGGAAFLMAVSAIGPGFMTQTTKFTAELGAAFAFGIIGSLVIDVGAQLNTWRAVCVSGKRAQHFADEVMRGLGPLVAASVVFGSFIFNVGNIGGCALGLQALFGTPLNVGACLSGALAVGLFLLPQMGRSLDRFSKLLGAVMILLTLYVAFVTHPPVGEVVVAFPRGSADLRRLFNPVITIIGGTVGGYVMFSGAHRMLDAGIAGVGKVREISRASVFGILITGVMRLVLFLAVFGVVRAGHTLGSATPVFDAFRAGAGEVGSRLSGLVFWCAAITSVVGCSYTSITFLGRSNSLAEGKESRQARPTVIFILLTLAVYLGFSSVLGLQTSPTALLVAAGTLNGILLPIALGVILVGVHRRSVIGDYQHPAWATVFGVIAWLVSVAMACLTLRELWTRLFS